jgi:effector-binding domain-containing protein
VLGSAVRRLSVSAAGRIQDRVLPAMTVATTLHIGPYEEFGHAYAALTDWIDLHHAETAGPVRERYLNGPGDGVAPAEYRTEVEMPIVAPPVLVPA